MKEKVTVEVEETSGKLYMSNPVAVKVIAALVQLFKEAGGENYVSMTGYDKDECYEITIQKKSGKTPSEVNIELKERIKNLENEIIKYMITPEVIHKIFNEEFGCGPDNMYESQIEDGKRKKVVERIMSVLQDNISLEKI